MYRGRRKNSNDEKFTVNAEGAGIIEIADDVVSSIVGLAVTEVDGVAQLSGDITRDLDCQVREEDSV